MSLFRPFAMPLAAMLLVSATAVSMADAAASPRIGVAVSPISHAPVETIGWRCGGYRWHGGCWHHRVWRHRFWHYY